MFRYLLLTFGSITLVASVTFDNGDDLPPGPGGGQEKVADSCCQDNPDCFQATATCGGFLETSCNGSKVWSLYAVNNRTECKEVFGHLGDCLQDKQRSKCADEHTCVFDYAILECVILSSKATNVPNACTSGPGC